MTQLKRDNYEKIYFQERVQQQVRDSVIPMMEQMYEQIRRDAAAHDEQSCLYRHHIAAVLEKQKWYPTEQSYADSDPDDLAMDYIAGMTDDYVVDYYAYLFPHSKYRISYNGYFDSGSVE